MPFCLVKHKFSILPTLVKVNAIFTNFGIFVGLHKKSHLFLTGGVKGSDLDGRLAERYDNSCGQSRKIG